MTQNERLRALLAEARDELYSLGESFAEALAAGCGGSAERYVRDARHLHARIDAALAEPPSPVETENARLDVAWQILVRERDEARALRAESDRVLASGVVVPTEQYAELVRAAGPNVSFLDELRLANERAETAQRERDEARAQRDEADSAAHLAETRLREIVELVGEGGDGTAFGSVESMLMAHKHMQETLRSQRDEARAEAERFKKAIHTRACQNQSAYNLECVCGADEHQRDLRTLAYRRGAEAMREAAMRFFADQQMYLNEKDIKNLPIPEDNP